MKTTTSKDGTTLAYDTYGSGPALIYVTGASCFRNFMPVVKDAKTFAKAFTVYNYDRRGRGDSGNTLPWSVEREVEDIEAMIDAASGSAYLYGHSSGAVLTLEAALKLGNKVKKAFIYDPSYVHDEKEKVEYAQLEKTVKALLHEGKNSKAMKRFLQSIGMPRAFVSLLPLFPGWGEMKRLAPTLAYDIALTHDLPPYNRMARIAVPMHIMSGAKNPAGMHSTARQLAEAIPGATFSLLKGQDHMVNQNILLPHLQRFLLETA